MTGRCPEAPAPATTGGRLGFAAWTRTWEDLGVGSPSRAVYERLLQCYSETRRAYHTLQHLDECFRMRCSVGATCEASAEIDLALWFHDAIYHPLRTDNELRSARWLDAVARDSGLGESSRLRLRGLVLATRHDRRPASMDEAVLLDTDLSILGASPARFEEYDRQVRCEFRHIPGLLYRRMRRRVLQGFLAKERIYKTDAYFDALEQQARMNLARAIGRLA